MLCHYPLSALSTIATTHHLPLPTVAAASLPPLPCHRSLATAPLPLLPCHRSLATALHCRPYHYSLAHKMRATGRLWIRPLVAEFPSDPKASADWVQGSHWLDGALLVAPVLSEDNAKKVGLALYPGLQHPHHHPDHHPDHATKASSMTTLDTTYRLLNTTF